MMHRQDASPLPSSIDPNWSIGIVYASFYKEECEAIVASARTTLLSAGISRENIKLYPVYGSFEIPLIGAALAEKKEVDALIGIGIVVQGETRHAQIIAEEAAAGMMQIQMRYQIPFAFEVLAVANIEQARLRADRGAEAARAVLHSLTSLKKIRA